MIRRAFEPSKQLKAVSTGFDEYMFDRCIIFSGAYCYPVITANKNTQQILIDFCEKERSNKGCAYNYTEQSYKGHKVIIDETLKDGVFAIMDKDDRQFIICEYTVLI